MASDPARRAMEAPAAFLPWAEGLQAPRGGRGRERDEGGRRKGGTTDQRTTEAAVGRERGRAARAARRKERPTMQTSRTIWSA